MHGVDQVESPAVDEQGDQFGVDSGSARVDPLERLDEVTEVIGADPDPFRRYRVGEAGRT